MEKHAFSGINLVAAAMNRAAMGFWANLPMTKDMGDAWASPAAALAYNLMLMLDRG